MQYTAPKRVFSGIFFVAIADSLYLFVSHIKNYTDISYQSFCAVSKAINCDIVSQSYWSILFGIPVSLWGVFAYLFLLIISVSPLINDNHKGRGMPVIVISSALFSLASIFFAFISAYMIKSYCIMCILSYAINFFLFFISCRFLIKFDELNFFDGLVRDIVFIKKSFFLRLVILVFITAIILVYFFMPKYWVMDSHSISANIKHGFENDSRDPWIGAENPVLTIYEYTDYLCFQCRKMHHYLRKLVDANPDKIRLVHINYPLDQGFNAIVVPEQFHEGSGKLALLSEYASDRDDFWKINDALFELARLRGSISVGRISEVTGLSANEINLALHHPFFRKSLNFDILRGMKKRILSTPSYIINDVVYEGIIPPEILKGVGIE